MDYKTIVTFVRDFNAEKAVLQAAAAMADARGGHLTVVCLGIDRTQPGAYYAGANAIALQQTLAEAQQAAEHVTGEVRVQLGNWPLQWDCVTVTAQIGAIGPVVGDFAQLADLTVVRKPYGPERSVEDVAIVESALFSGRTPILVLPAGHADPIRPKKATIAWNQSPEAMTAIRAAMPLLKECEQVNVAIVDPPAHSADRSDPGGRLAEFLVRHGVRVDISVLAKTMPRVSDVLCRHVEDQAADLLVMGGYGHSRFREAILGGATRSMLEVSKVPVLMAH